MEAYCVKCKTKREMQDPEPVFTNNGMAATKGKCPVCGATLFRMGATEAHQGLSPIKSESDHEKKAKRSKLVIVESPAKARTVGKFLGAGYTVRASVGHVRDLLRSQLSVDVENNYQPKYRVPNEKRQVVKELKILAQKADEIYLATDPDREGEAIAWHLLEAAKIDEKHAQRVVFHEITKPAIEEAFAHPRKLDMDLINAQQARRVLDRLVGYNLSPLLWQKVRSRLSAGRVQSVALRLIVEREREIEAFTPQEYWHIAAELHPKNYKKDHYKANLIRVDDKEFEFHSEEEVRPILEAMEAAEYVVSKIKRGERKRKPAAPFTTSTLQQEASRRLGFTAKRTMAIAQQLYEGIDIHDGSSGPVGLITYMRTDSVNISPIAQQEARTFIEKEYGASYLPPSPPFYKTKAQRAQEAHEAIRPTSVMRTPKSLEPYLDRSQYRLYELIWQRFVASQMASAVYDTLTVEISGTSPQHNFLLRTSGSTVQFPGFLILYEEAADEDQKPSEDEALNIAIPASLTEGQQQILIRVLPTQHFTQPPPRYNDATLIRTLEEYGIGRPSTYAPTLTTLQNRGYVVRESKRLVPTDTGFVVNDLLMEHFPDILNYQFTAQMESDLDLIAAGERDWVNVVDAFYRPFSQMVKKAEDEMPEVKAEPEYVGKTCPQCGKELIVRYGRYGKFIACSNFPECRYTEAWLEKIGVACPKCSVEAGGEIVLRKSRKGRVFYGCSRYPECDFVSWKQPLAKPCPICGHLLVVANRKQAQCTECETMFSLDEVSEEKETVKAS